MRAFYNVYDYICFIKYKLLTFTTRQLPGVLLTIRRGLGEAVRSHCTQVNPF